MGKAFNFLAALIFIDLLFIITGQACSSGGCTLTSIIFNSLLNLANFQGETFFVQLFGDITNFAGSTTGILSILITTGVTLGAILTKSDTLLFIPMAMGLALIGSDFIIIYTILFSLNAVLATLVMGPIIILYAFTMIEWLRSKD